VPLGGDLRGDFLAFAGIASDEGKPRIPAADLAADGVNHSAPGAVDGVKVDFVKPVLQWNAPENYLVSIGGTLTHFAKGDTSSVPGFCKAC
jgi:hypothetical protein